MSLRDRFFTPRVAKAITSVGALASAAVVGGLAFAAVASIWGPGWGLVAAVVGCAVGWAGRVAVAVASPAPGSVATSLIDPFTLDEPWRRLLQRSLSSRSHFQDAVRSTPDGPTRDRLEAIGDSMDAAIDQAWSTARAGHTLGEALARIDPGRARRELARLRGDAPSSGATPTTGSEATAAALEARIASGERMARQIDSATDRLAVLNGRLDESVTRCVELSVGTFRPDELGAVDAGLVAITDELEALRGALSSLEPAPGPGPESGRAQGSTQ